MRRGLCRQLRAFFFFAAAIAATLSPDTVMGERSAPDGAAIFSDQCIDCHGELGQGSDYHELPLIGDLPIRELARVISDTMPEGDAESCVGAEAEAVARHVYETFYSPIAQARLRPPRRSLSRLTVRQHQQTLADLVGAFRWSANASEERGLSAKYHTVRKFLDRQVHHERVEPTIDLVGSVCEFLPDEARQPPPDPGTLTDEQRRRGRLDLIIDLNGGLFAPRTGRYDFVVESPNSVRLQVNRRPVIDQMIRSDDMPVLRGSTYLIEGRTYPISLHVQRTIEPDLSVRLKWRPPRGVEELVPTRYLHPAPHPPTHAVATRFPPDDTSSGLLEADNVSAAWQEAVADASIETAAAIQTDLPHLSKEERKRHPSDDPDEFTAEAARAFVTRLAETAFRRSLSEEETARYVDAHFESTEPKQKPAAVTDSIEQATLAILMSPQLLYPELGAGLATESQRASARLALALHDSLPDRQLRRLAAKGQLTEEPRVRREAERMLDDPRTRSKFAAFVDRWLRIDEVGQLARDSDRFPDFSDRVAADMRASLERMIEDVVWHGSGDLRELFTTDTLPVNDRLAEFLAVEPPGSGDRFVAAGPDTAERAGLVTHPYLLTTFSYYRDTSPIHRGVFLARHVLGRALMPPPDAVAPLAPELAPDLTTRERVAHQTSPGQCQSCHVLINDLGFTLEQFDAVGRLRVRDAGKPIDTRGGYIDTTGGEVSLAGARELAHYLADSPDMHRAFVTQLFHHTTGQPLQAYDEPTRRSLHVGFTQQRYNIRWLLAEIATVYALAE